MHVVETDFGPDDNFDPDPTLTSSYNGSLIGEGDIRCGYNGNPRYNCEYFLYIFREVNQNFYYQ